MHVRRHAEKGEEKAYREGKIDREWRRNTEKREGERVEEKG